MTFAGERSPRSRSRVGFAVGLALAAAIVLPLAPQHPRTTLAGDAHAADSQATAVQDAPIPDDPNAGLAPDESIVPPPCPLCAEDPGAPVRVLTLADVQTIGQSFADANVARLARIDSLRLAGAFGKANSDQATRDARIMAKLLTLNAYSYMIQFGAHPDTVWQADETTLGPAFDSFSDPGIVPLVKLTRARMGLGHMCAKYDLSQKVRTETIIGGRKFAVRIDDVTIRGQKVRALIMDLPTSLHDVVEVWLTEHIRMDVSHPFVNGPPAPYEAYILENMRGMWVHKAGLHRPEAFVFWVTPRDPARTKLPSKPLVGARIYVPHLQLRLPSILPDIGFEDLREVDLPQPILELSYLREGDNPPWLQQSDLRGFKSWDGIGPLPPGLRAHFPDR